MSLEALPWAGAKALRGGMMGLAYHTAMRPSGTPLDWRHALTRGLGAGVLLSAAGGAWDVLASRAISSVMKSPAFIRAAKGLRRVVRMR